MSPTAVTTTRTILIAAVACAALTGCSSDTAGEQAASPATAAPGSDVPCPVTSTTPVEDHPDAVRDGAGGTSWYGTGGLWVDLGNFAPAHLPTGPAPVSVKHAWWTGNESGDSTDRRGRPQVRAVQLDGDGEVRTGDEDGYATADGFSWWPTVLEFPARGCWAVTGELGDTTVRFVVEI